MQAIRLGELAVEFAKHLSSMSNLFHVDCKHEAAADKAEDTFAKRIWHRAKSAPKALESGGLGFPNWEFPSGLPDPEREDIRKGQFRVDFLIVTPGALAPVFEVYLQGICFIQDGGLPACNLQFG